MPVRTPTKIGQRSRIWLSEEEYKIESPSGTTVSWSSSLCLHPSSDNQAGKKLKKRLEDLEKRAGSSSASPEQRHEELAQPGTSFSERSDKRSIQHQRSTSNQVTRDSTPEVLNQQYGLPADDRSMFSQQYTRQLSTSPPPFSYAAMSSTEGVAYTPYPTTSYCGMQSANIDMPLYPQYLPSLQQSYIPNMSNAQIKQEFYGDDDMSPFSMSYASMAGVDASAAQSYHDAAAYVSTRPQYSRAYTT